MDKIKKDYDLIGWILILPVFLFMIRSVKVGQFLDPVVLLFALVIFYVLFF